MFSLPPEILANWLQPGALVAGAVGGMGLLIGAFRSLRGELKDEMRAGEDRVNRRIDEVKEEMKDFKDQVKEEMRAGEDRVNRRIDEVKEEMKDFKDQVKEEMRAGEDRMNKRIDEVKEEMKEFKQEMGEIKTLLIQALRLPPPAQP